MHRSNAPPDPWPGVNDIKIVAPKAYKINHNVFELLRLALDVKIDFNLPVRWPTCLHRVIQLLQALQSSKVVVKQRAGDIWASMVTTW